MGAAVAQQLTPKKLVVFLAALASYGNVTQAAKVCGASREALYRLRRDDTEFAAAWDEASEHGANALEDEARRRAFRGVLEPVYQGGAKVGSIRKYSDTLLIFLLKGARPEKYRDQANVKVSATHEHSGPNGSPIPIAYFDASATIAALAAGSAADRASAGLAGLLDGGAGDGETLG